MPWKIIAIAFGWRALCDEDGNPASLIVRHAEFRRRFGGSDAWQQAVLFSIRAPGARPPILRKEPRP